MLNDALADPRQGSMRDPMSGMAPDWALGEAMEDKEIYPQVVVWG